MAKATLEFDLNDPDDQMAHLRAVKSLDITLALWEMLYNTKKSFQWKMESGEIKENDDILEKVYERFWEILDEHGIKIDELVI
jgi:DNA-binding ferritin-like protein